MKQLVTIEARPNASKTKSTYYLSWRADGKRIRKSLRHSDPYLAEKQRRQKEIELGTYVPVKTGGEKKLLSEAVMLYLMANRKLRPSTRSLTLRSFDFLVLSAGDIPIGRFDYAAAEQFQAWCIETGRNGTTANIYTKSIRPVFTWAIKQKWIYSDPFSELTLFKRSKKRIRLYEPDEFTAMLSKCPDDLWRARLLAAKTAGLRRGEVLNLTRDDIDFRGGVIHLQEKLETPCTWLWEVKDKDRREVPLVELFVSHPGEMKASLARQKYINGAGNEYQHKALL